MNDASATYTVIHVRGCRVIKGPVPIDDLVALMHAWSDRDEDKTEKWIVDSLLSQHLGANLVCGPLNATLEWRADLGIRTPSLDNESDNGHQQ